MTKINNFCCTYPPKFIGFIIATLQACSSCWARWALVVCGWTVKQWTHFFIDEMLLSTMFLQKKWWTFLSKAVETFAVSSMYPCFFPHEFIIITIWLLANHYHQALVLHCSQISGPLFIIGSWEDKNSQYILHKTWRNFAWE